MDRSPELGFIGLGAMGGRIAKRLLAAGHRLAAFDSRPEALARISELGAEACHSAVEIADRAQVVLLSLPTPAAVLEVTTGVSGLVGGSAIRNCVDLSTTGPSISRQIAQSLSTAGICFVDAPVSGGVSGAEAGTLTVMAACERHALERVSPILGDFAANVFHVGLQAGMGQLAKVLNNLLSATALAATAEVLVLGVHGGLEPGMLVDVFNASTGRNSATAQKFPAAVLPRTFDSGFALALMNKDVQMCLDEAKRAGLSLPIGVAVGRRWAQAAEWATAGADCTEIVKLVESEAGTTMAADGDRPH